MSFALITGKGPLSQGFEYKIKPEDAMSIKPGVRVEVPVGQRHYVGIVLALLASPTYIGELKTITRVLPENVDATNQDILLWQWLAHYYHQPIGRVVMLALPKLWLTPRPIWGRKQVQPIVEPVLETSTAPVVLNTEQMLAAQTIVATKGFACHVLAGVTGSGKTEVYCQVAETVLAQGGQVLFIVPEIGLTPQLMARVQSRLRKPVLVWHSQCTDRQRAVLAAQARLGQFQIIVGTRSAVFMPLARLRLIVVDEEHDPSLKQQAGVRYHARDVAIKRAQLLQIPIILGSATPSMEVYANALQGRYRWLPLKRGYFEEGKREFYLIDLRRQNLQSGLSQSLLSAIKAALLAKEQVMLFINRRGYAPVLMCHDCGWLAQCPACELSLTVHRQAQQLLCHHCGYQARLPSQCPSCEQQDITPVGVGTERLAEFLQDTFPEARIERIDRSTMERKQVLAEKLVAIARGEVDIVVGTQMLAKGHHFKHLAVVAVVDADAGLFSADFRSMERAAQLLVQVFGRVGREKPGKVYIQTHQPEHPLITTLLTSDYFAFANALLEERASLQLPPYRFFALLRAEAKQQALAEAAIAQALQTLTVLPEGVEVLGPVPALLPKRAHYYRVQALLTAKTRPGLHQALSVLEAYLALQKTRTIRWVVDVDPLEVV